VTGLDASIAAGSPLAGRRLAGYVGDALETFRLAGRVLRQHWPTLLALALGGEILRGLALRWAATVWVFHGPWFWFVYALAPAFLSLALVLMLLRVRTTLPGLVPSAGSMWAQAAALTIPFLVFYQQAYLDLDQHTVNVEFLEVATNAAVRAGLSPGQWLPPRWISVVAALIIVVVRWIAGRLPVVKRHPMLSLPAVYLEVLFILVGLEVIAGWWEKALEWAQGRRAWVGAVDWLHGDFAWAGPGSGVLRAVFGWWTGVWPTVQSGLIIPIAAIAAGAVVYGVRLERETRPRHRRPGSVLGAATATLVGGAWRGIAGRLGPALQALRVMLRAGIIVTLAFCLGYVALELGHSWMNIGERALIGPQDADLFWWPVGRVLDRFNDAVVLVLLVCLLAGAVGCAALRIGTPLTPRVPQPSPADLQPEEARL
jgi:hypothetical protein